VEATGVRGEITSHIIDAAHEMPGTAPESLLVPAFVARQASAIEAALGERLQLHLDGQRAAPHWTRCAAAPSPRAGTDTFELAGARPAEIELRGPLHTWEVQHETYFNIYSDGAIAHQDLLDRTHASSRFATGILQRRRAVVRKFVAEGVHHIFIGPDHIL